jgi:hypothetical protein
MQSAQSYLLGKRETRTVFFPSLWGSFFVDIARVYLFPCGLELLLLWDDCLCSWSLCLSFGVAVAHRSSSSQSHADLQIKTTLTLISGRGIHYPHSSQSNVQTHVAPHRSDALPRSPTHFACCWALCVNSESFKSSPDTLHQDRTCVSRTHPFELVRECVSRCRVGAHVARGPS